MVSEINPGLILIVGALLMPIVPHVVRGLVSLALPLIAMLHLWTLPFGDAGTVALFGYELVTLRVDKLSFAFGFVFLLAALLAAIYALHVRGWLEAMTAQMYAGAAIGAVFAGDLITLFVFWEITAIASVFLIWANRTERAIAVGMRYLVVQVSSGVILLSGVLIYAHQSGSITFSAIADIDIATMDQTSLAAWLILLAIGIKCAFPLLHAWLPDAYPEGTVTGTVWLSAFTTKLAVYALVRGFPGSDILIPIGIVMTIYPLVYAILEDDLRRVLCHALNSQLGFMVIGVGIGTGFAISAVTAQAFGSILYKALLFMSIGAVLYRTGTARASELGGLAKSMPWTASFAIIGAMAMSTPLFIGYVGKALLSAAVAADGALITWVILTLTSAGVFLVVGLRLITSAFFATDRQLRPSEAPGNMQFAMAGAAVACFVFGAAPWLLYDLLPAPVTYDVYKPSSVVTQFQMLVFTALVFTVFSIWGWLPRPRPTTLINADWFYRKLGYNIGATLLLMMRDLVQFVGRATKAATLAVERNISRTHNPDGILGRTWATGTMAFVATAMLAAYLLIFYARALTTG